VFQSCTVTEHLQSKNKPNPWIILMQYKPNKDFILFSTAIVFWRPLMIVEYGLEVTLHIWIRGVLGSNLGRNTRYPDRVLWPFLLPPRKCIKSKNCTLPSRCSKIYLNISQHSNSFRYTDSILEASLNNPPKKFDNVLIIYFCLY
jgi:hypothetical protein